MASAGKHHVNNTIYVLDNNYTYRQVIDACKEDIAGTSSTLGAVQTNGTWQLTLDNCVDVENILDNGLEINGEEVEVRLTNKKVVTVSFFGVPYFIGNDELTSKLHDFGVIQKSPWIRKTYKEYPEIESGIVFTRIEMPPNVRSLPYATKIGNINVTIKHNGQVKVCNGCLSPDHLLR